jgi:hypothetical protein
LISINYPLVPAGYYTVRIENIEEFLTPYSNLKRLQVQYRIISAGSQRDRRVYETVPVDCPVHLGLETELYIGVTDTPGSDRQINYIRPGQGATDNLRYFKFEVDQRGGHYHIAVRSGNHVQSTNGGMVLLGKLVMDEKDWTTLRAGLELLSPAVRVVEKNDDS